MRVALTQGVVDLDQEHLDCLDQAWATVLEAWGHLPVPVPVALRHPEEVLEAFHPSALIVTGGPVVYGPPDVAPIHPEQEDSERRLIEWCERQQVPVIGICRGMELLLSIHGGRLREIAGHVSHRHLVSVRETPFSGAGGLREVNSFHRRAVESHEVRVPLVPFAWDADGNVEAFYRTADGGRLREVGLMWHPEMNGVAEWASLSFNSLLRYVESQNRADPPSAS